MWTTKTEWQYRRSHISKSQDCPEYTYRNKFVSLDGHIVNKSFSSIFSQWDYIVSEHAIFKWRGRL